MRRRLLPALAVPHLAAAGSGVAARPFKTSGEHRRIGLLWRTAFPGSDDLVALGKFIQERLPREVQPAGKMITPPMSEPTHDLSRAPVDG